MRTTSGAHPTLTLQTGYTQALLAKRKSTKNDKKKMQRIAKNEVILLESCFYLEQPAKLSGNSTIPKQFQK